MHAVSKTMKNEIIVNGVVNCLQKNAQNCMKKKRAKKLCKQFDLQQRGGLLGDRFPLLLLLKVRVISEPLDETAARSCICCYQRMAGRASSDPGAGGVIMCG